jgi:hypothetical protein
MKMTERLTIRPLAHAGRDGANKFERREEMRFEPEVPAGAVHGAEIVGSLAHAWIGDEDVRCGTGGKQGLTIMSYGNVAGHILNVAAGFRGELACGSRKRFG